MTQSTVSTVSTGEYLLTLEVNGKRHGLIVVPAGNLAEYHAMNMHGNIVMQGNTYGDKGAIEMFDYYKTKVKQDRDAKIPKEATCTTN